MSNFDFSPAESPTFYYIGVTTGKSSIMRVFPKWAEHLGLGDTHFIGIDCKIHDDPNVYRKVVDFIKQDKHSWGALVTSHKIDLYDLKKGIIKFRGCAMLCFGNFRFAYRELVDKKEDELQDILNLYCVDPTKLQTEFEKRPEKMFEIESIPKEWLWYLGRISGEKVNSEMETLVVEIRKFKQR